MPTVDGRKRKQSVAADSTVKKRKKQDIVGTVGNEVSDNNSHRKKHKYACNSSTEDVDEHSALLGAVTGQLQRLPLEGSVCESDCKGKGHQEERLDKDLAVKRVAAEYLVLWSTKRDCWSFKKKTQYWLLQNMYDKKKVGCHFV